MEFKSFGPQEEELFTKDDFAVEPALKDLEVKRTEIPISRNEIDIVEYCLTKNIIVTSLKKIDTKTYFINEEHYLQKQGDVYKLW